MPGSKPSCSAPLLDALVHKVHQHLGMDFSAQRSAELLRGQRVIEIDHEGQRYRLQATRQGKLILTK